MNMAGSSLLAVANFIKVFCAISSIFLAVFVFRNNRKSIFPLLALAFGLFSLGNAGLNLAAFYFQYAEHRFAIFYPIFGTLLPFLLVHFYLSFPYQPRWVKTWHLVVFYLPYGYFLYTALTEGYYSRLYVYKNVILMDAARPYYVMLIWEAISFITAIAIIIIKKAKTEKFSVSQKQLDILLKGIALSGLFFVVGQILQCRKIYWYIFELGYVTLYGSMCYAIIKYRAFNIRTAIQYTALYGVMVLIVLLPLVGVVYLELWGGSYDAGEMIAFGVISIVYFLVVSQTVFPLLRKLTFRRQLNLDQVADQAIANLVELGAREELLRFIAKCFRENLQATEVVLVEKKSGVGGYRAESLVKKGVFEISEREIGWLEQFQGFVTETAIKEFDTGVLAQKGIEGIWRPNQKETGWLFLGNKGNLKAYDLSDAHFIEKVGKSFASALDKLEKTQKAAEVELLSNLKTNLFVNLAHETKTPLTIIINHLEKYQKNHPVTDELRSIKENTQVLQRLLVNFLDMEKMDRGQVSYSHDQTIDLSEFVERKVTIFTPIAESKEIDLKLAVEPGLCTRIDPFALDRIMNNLLDNAIKYNQPRGMVEVRLTSWGDGVVLKVSDTGIGIPEEQIQHIFKPYYQVSRKKRNIQGIGMGLAIVSRIMEEVSGSIEVLSKTHEGSSFTLSFKRCFPGENVTKRVMSEITYSAPFTSEAIPEVKDSLFIEGRECLLVVEDKPELLNSIKVYFAGEYNVFCARSGVEAIGKLTDGVRPGVIISDVMMDRMDGLELLDALRAEAKYADIPVVFLTAKTSTEERLEGLRRGAVDYINKPFSMEELAAKVRSHCEIQRLKLILDKRATYETIGKLTATVSHEVLNPLSGIIGPFETLCTAIGQTNIAGEKKVMDAINHINTNTERIEKTLKSLRMLAGEKIQVGRVDVRAVYENAKALFVGKRLDGLTLNENIEEGLVINGNSSALLLILGNLLKNALDAVGDSGEITVTMGRASGAFTLTVADTGCGIEERNLSRLFDMGYTTKEKGTGLGLYFVRDIAKKLNWTVGARSEVGKGSVFTVSEQKA